MVPFHEDRLPLSFRVGATGGPGFNTGVMGLPNGSEYRNVNWSQYRKRWTVSLAQRDAGEIETLQTFFILRGGMAYGFRVKDPIDYQIANWQTIGLGDGANKVFQAFKLYQRGTYSYSHILKKLVAGTVRVRVNGVELVLGSGAGKFTVDVNTGLITLGTAAAAGIPVDLITQFDVPVRFDTDQLEISLETINIGEWAGVPIIELRPDDV